MTDDEVELKKLIILARKAIKRAEKSLDVGISDAKKALSHNETGGSRQFNR